MVQNNIPDHWSAKEALAVYDFLSELREEIWGKYKAEIVGLLVPGDFDKTDSPQLDVDDFNDDISF